MEDIYWTMDDYNEMFETAGFDLEAVYAHKGKDDEPFDWISEKDIPPWIIYVLKKKIENTRSGC